MTDPSRPASRPAKRAIKKPRRPKKVQSFQAQERNPAQGGLPATELPSNLLDKLSDELIYEVVMYLPPLEVFFWSRTCKRLLTISETPYFRASYFMRRHPRPEAVFHALLCSRLFVSTPSMLSIMINSGAIFSRYLVQSLVQSYTRGRVHFIHKSPRYSGWGRPDRMPFQAFSLVLSVAADRMGDISLIQGVDDGAMFLSWIRDAKTNAWETPESHLTLSTWTGHAIPRKSLDRRSTSSQRCTDGLSCKERRWEQIVTLFEEYHFHPFCIADPLNADLPYALVQEPRLLPLLLRNGFSFTDAYRTEVLRRVLASSEMVAKHLNIHFRFTVNDTQKVASLMSQQVMIYCNAPTLGWKVSRELVAEVFADVKGEFKVRHDAAAVALQLLEKQGVLEAPITDVVCDLILALRGTRKLFEQRTWINNMIEALPALKNVPEMTDILLVLLFEQAQGTYSNPQRPWLASELQQKIRDLGLTVEAGHIKRVMCNEFLHSPDLPLIYAADRFYCDNDTSFEIFALIEDVVTTILLSKPSMGTMLLGLYNKYKSHVADICRRVLRNIDLDLETLTKHGSHSADRSAACLATWYTFPWSHGLGSDEPMEFMDERGYNPVSCNWSRGAKGGLRAAVLDPVAEQSGKALMLRHFQDRTLTGAVADADRAREYAHGKAFRWWWNGQHEPWVSRQRSGPGHSQMSRMQRELAYRTYPAGHLPTYTVLVDFLRPGERSWEREVIKLHAIYNGNLSVVQILMGREVEDGGIISLRMFKVCATQACKIPAQWAQGLVKGDPVFYLDETHIDPRLRPNPLETPKCPRAASDAVKWYCHLEMLLRVEEDKVKARRTVKKEQAEQEGQSRAPRVFKTPFHTSLENLLEELNAKLSQGDEVQSAGKPC